MLQGICISLHLFQSTLPAREATAAIGRFCGGPTISIHASREGSDPERRLYVFILSGFQSTLPAREATSAFFPAPYPSSISIHASREGSDAGGLRPHAPRHALFQSTLPAREATKTEPCRFPICIYFNPRFPRGKRLCRMPLLALAHVFQSTLPAREAT